MLTPFGKVVRKIRIDEGVTLKEMAKMLGKSSSFLSAIEMGRKAIPADLTSKIAVALNLDAAKSTDLDKAAQISHTKFKIDIGEQAPTKDRELVAMFARGFPNISDAEKEEIKRILEGREI